MGNLTKSIMVTVCRRHLGQCRKNANNFPVLPAKLCKYFGIGERFYKDLKYLQCINNNCCVNLTVINKSQSFMEICQGLDSAKILLSVVDIHLMGHRYSFTGCQNQGII